VPPRTGATPARQRDQADAGKSANQLKKEPLQNQSDCRPAQGQRQRDHAEPRKR
jgi:hypothetical protein